MSAEAEKMETEAPKAYVPSPAAVDISPSQDKAVLKEIITAGEGDETPCKGNRVFVHYTGKLTDGTIFDSSVGRGDQFEFTLGTGQVIKAWDIGVATMKKGEKCLLICHPDYAYGKKGSPPKIPENATLLFEVELFSWEMEDLSSDKDKGILRTIITDGDGFITPSEGSNVEVHLLGRCGGKQFEEKDVKFEIGVGCEAGIVDGLERALKNFKKGEKSKIILAPGYAFGSEGDSELGVPPNSTVEYEVTLNAFEKEKEAWNMTSEEKLEHSEIAKTRGTNYFKAEKFEVALNQYRKVSSFLQSETEMEGENKEKRNSLLCAAFLNIAACYLKSKSYEDVLDNCEKALQIDAKNIKGLFRKGQAHLALNDYETAKLCFNQVLAIEPSNKAAQKNFYACKESLKKELDKEKKMYQNIFKKMAEQKDEEPQVSTDDSNKQENGVTGTMETEDNKQAEDVQV